jgi:hypothetical protein
VNDGFEPNRDETSDKCNTMLGMKESRMTTRNYGLKSLRKPIKS